MPDQKPPRLAGTEAATLWALLQYQRESVVRKVTGVADEAAARSPVASGTSLVWLTRHLAQAEMLWVLVRFAGLDVELPRDRPRPGDTVAEAVELYRTTWGRVDPVLAESPLDAPCRGPAGDPPVNLRWVLTHLLEETARHAGHADILRELIDGQTGR